MPASSKDGIAYAMQHEERNGRRPRDVSSDRTIKGVDIVSLDSNGQQRLIEVKATEQNGIPDAFETEFYTDLKFVGTHLYLVKFNPDRTFDSLHVMPKHVIDEYSTTEAHGTIHRVVRHIKFASGLTRRLRGGEFATNE